MATTASITASTISGGGIAQQRLCFDGSSERRECKARRDGNENTLMKIAHETLRPVDAADP
jgi:hypothetical protein